MSESDNASSASAKFLCDSMLGGLARWLRAAGYDAEFHYGIDDGLLVSLAQVSGKILLSSDGPMFQRNAIRSGAVRALYVPGQLSRTQQLRYVLQKLSLPLRAARCMACGGELVETPKHKVMDEAPPLAFRRCERFWRCGRCGKLFWHGTHWTKIILRLADLGKTA